MRRFESGRCFKRNCPILCAKRECHAERLRSSLCIGSKQCVEVGGVGCVCVCVCFHSTRFQGATLRCSSSRHSAAVCVVSEKGVR